MTCNPCAGVADLKAICKDILKAVGPNSTNAYAALNFTEVDTEGGNITWRHLLIRLDISNISHRRLRNVLLYQPANFLSAGPPLQLGPWHETPFNIQDLSAAIPTPMQERTTVMVAAFIKTRWTPLNPNQKHLRWFTAPLSDDPTNADDITTYADCETNTVHISIDTQDNNSGITTPALPGRDFSASRLLIALGTLATQYAHATRDRDLNAYKLDRISHALNFSELRKSSLPASSCTALCKNPSDAFTLISAKSILIPFTTTSMLISFSPTRNPATRALMSPESNASMLNHKEFFFQGGLPITITSTITLPPYTFFNLILLALTSYQQLQTPPTSMGSDDGAA
jgi:hypothetical protein